MNAKVLVPVILLTVLVGSIPTILSYYINPSNTASRYIVSDGMIPTLQVNDRVIIEKNKYKSQSPKRGDIIDFHPTEVLRSQGFKDDFIKRIIGLPGERIEVKDGGVYINNTRLKESYIYNNDPTSIEVCPPENSFLKKPVTIPKDQYFTLGDNRNNSYDSRCWGFVQRNEIIGQATQIFWPLKKIGRIPTPHY
jgi:signal peptidase I